MSTAENNTVYVGGNYINDFRERMKVYDWMDETFGEENVDYYDIIKYVSKERSVEDPNAPCIIWSDGDMILVQKEDVADYMADWIEVHCVVDGEPVDYVKTSYYDPIEDERDGCVDDYTGWYCVDID